MGQKDRLGELVLLSCLCFETAVCGNRCLDFLGIPEEKVRVAKVPDEKKTQKQKTNTQNPKNKKKTQKLKTHQNPENKKQTQKQKVNKQNPKNKNAQKQKKTKQNP